MAKISASTSEKVVSIRQFLGLHEAKDGDNKIKLGEATVCRNFKITNDGNLKKREGSKTLYNLNTSIAHSLPVKGLWHGWVSRKELFLAACDGKLYRLSDNSTGDILSTRVEIGSIDTTNDVTFIPFEDKLYLMNGVAYMQLSWVVNTTYPNGQWVLEDISTGTGGYRPLVAITVGPSDGGATLEQVNKLNKARRVWLSTVTGESTYTLPEVPTTSGSLDYVKSLLTGEYLVAGTDYSYDLSAGTMTFLGEFTKAANSYEVGYSMPTSYASQVKAMRFAELYSGTQDTRIFIYGDGSNEAFYTGLDYNGNPRGDYFPDLNEVAVGDSNTPITGIIRHYSKLAVYKATGCYSIEYGVVTLADSSVTPAFYVTPLNRELGNEAEGQVQLVLNAPYTLCKGNVYEWRNASSYTSNLTTDERQAKRISDRVYATLATYDFANCHCYDDNLHTTYYLINSDGNMLCYNYYADAWYEFTGLNAYKIVEYHDTVYIGRRDGKLSKLDESLFDDDEVAIDCLWESGSMDFGAAYMRKFSAMLWVGIKAELNNEVYVTVQSDRTDDNAVLHVDPDYTTDKPQTKRCKIKVKKFNYFKLIFKSLSNDTRVTVVGTDVKVRYTSYAK